MSTGEETEHPDGCCGVGPTDDDTTTSIF